MKKRMIGAVLCGYLLVLVTLSLPLPFLEGDYFGFFPTFGLLSILTWPLLVGSLALWQGISALLRKGSRQDLVCGALGFAVLLIYPLSFFGVLKGGVLVALFPFAALLIVIFWLWRWIADQIKQSRRNK